MTLPSGAHLLAIFRYEIYAEQAKRLRLFHNWMEHDGRRPLTQEEQRRKHAGDARARRFFSVVQMVEFMRGQFMGEEDITDIPENWPRFALSAEKMLERVGATPAMADVRLAGEEAS